MSPRFLLPGLSESPCPGALTRNSGGNGKEQRHQQRRQQAEPVLAKLNQWLDEQRPQALPKSALGQAIGYALNH
jgi:hypothetical protein